MSGPGWTDENVHDPGSPLLELFAFLKDLLLFRADPREPGRRRRLLVVLLTAAAGLLWRRRNRVR